MSMKRKTLLPVFALPALMLTLFLTSSAWAAEVPAGDGWRLLETEHFTLFSNLGESDAKEIAVDLERLRSVLEGLFTDATFDSPVPNLIYVFADRESFDLFSLGGEEPGFYAPHIHASFAAVVGEDAAEALPIVYRQYLYELARHNIPQVPLWFRTGLAEIFATFTSQGGGAVVGLPIETSAALTGVDSMPVADLLGISEMPQSSGTARAFVTTSWGLAHYLLVDDAGRLEATRRLIAEFEADPTIRKTIAEALGVTLEELQANLAAYLSLDPLPRLEVAVPATSIPVEVTPLSRAEALTHLGDLRAHTAPEDRALTEACFATAFELDPEYGPPIAGLGYLKELAGDIEGARDMYADALELYPEGFRIQFYAGESELQLLGHRRPQNPVEQVRLESAIRAFEQVTRLRPEYGEGWARLGYAANLRPEPSPEAVMALEKAYEMLAERADVAHNLLLAYARAGRRDKAVELVRALPAKGADQETVRRSWEVVFQLELQMAVGMAREKRYDDAVGVLGRIVTETGNETLRDQARQTLTAILPAAAPNDFADRYEQAYQAMETGNPTEARTILADLDTAASGEIQKAVIADLARRVED